MSPKPPEIRQICTYENMKERGLTTTEDSLSEHCSYFHISIFHQLISNFQCLAIILHFIPIAYHLKPGFAAIARVLCSSFSSIRAVKQLIEITMINRLNRHPMWVKVLG